jgi:uncharacterized protein (TIGR00299 family) protein
MKLLYLDCGAGAAGDMLLGALLDAGADEELVRATLDRIGLAGWELVVHDVDRAGLRATKIEVRSEPSEHHRNLATIRELLSPLDEPVRSMANEAFLSLAKAEATVHRTAMEEIHFHEVGALDALIDIVGTCAAAHSLRVDRVTCSAVPLGSGTATAAHGVLPVPAPATLELIKKHGIPVRSGGEGETVTPTGAALLATLADGFDDLPPMRIDRVGYGAGDRDPISPNVVRAYVGEAVAVPSSAAHLMIETNVDDMASELIPYALGALLRAGADDAWAKPIQMKKDRPAFLLSALTHRSRRSEVLDALFRETTTFGCRIYGVEKEELERSWIETTVDEHIVRVKVAKRGGEVVTMSPEYEDAVKAARATGIALKDVYYRAVQEAVRLQDRSR